MAGAYAESAPVVVISGAPGTNEIQNDPMLHHRFGPFAFQREIFERITCATAVIDDPVLAFRQIDRALAAALRHRKPVYIELPRDLVEQPGVTVAAPPDEQLETRDEAAWPKRLPRPRNCWRDRNRRWSSPGWKFTAVVCSSRCWIS